MRCGVGGQGAWGQWEWTKVREVSEDFGEGHLL